ncbi:NACHT domain-containing protein [Laspinema sp. A4]|uniref:NACHT domain-containing protein n=1 Tax=Laspinema sp. D2d TaxID=2953686 RepID=UPI0021BAE24F|nr:NACHT domain-containing protein [Laspinema sp. D2d]MCT7986297.1 NACHT domain-containing protein [Laspinema sp. D2d]
MLNRRLSSNLLTANEDINFNLDDIHVPLALVERRQRDKRPGETRAEEGSQLYEPTGYEEKQRFEHDQFLQDILGKGEGKTKGRQIAIIGEPGAGKTTLLQKIAFWILEERSDLPIWISLADLQGRELGDYLRETWLKQGIPSSRLSEQVREDFLAQLEQRRVWLLLDGVDEMAKERATAGLPLQQIATQLKGWIASARVVLTCRVNVWEANLNALEAFETYRMLNYNYPSNVQEFIRKFFVKDPANGEALRQELAKAEYQRLQDLVKNPLRLTLLCMTWQISRGLPKTQAELYKRFVDQFYIWKSNSKNKRFHTIKTQRDELNKAFGELAKRGIDDPASPFRLPHRLVTEVLGDRDDDNSLFALALELSWLNDVGVAVEDESENVYAFYHATFQEYFAALSLEDWDFFLPREHCDRPVRGKKSYRIFDPLWKQTILLWLGREDVLKESKEEFIQKLFDFKDGCINFYSYSAIFLAAGGLAECNSFISSNISDPIIERLMIYAFGYWNPLKNKWEKFLDSIEQAARSTLQETNQEKALQFLEKQCYIFDALEKDWESQKRNSKIWSQLKVQVGQTLNRIAPTRSIPGLNLNFHELPPVICPPIDIPCKFINISSAIEHLYKIKDDVEWKEPFLFLQQIGDPRPEVIECLIFVLKNSKNEKIIHYSNFLIPLLSKKSVAKPYIV